MTFSAYMVEEILRNKPTYMIDRSPFDRSAVQRFIKYGEERYLLAMLNRSRAMRDAASVILDSAENDGEREVYLMRLYFVESMVGYRRTICERFFFEDSMFGMRSKWHRSSVYQYFCTAMIPTYLLFFSFYVLLFGISVGQETTKRWFAVIIIAFSEDLLLVEPAVSLFYSIFVASVVYKDVLVLSKRIFSRQKTILNRVKDQLDPMLSMVQHFDPACRLARQYPALYASRLLMSLNDADIPTAYLARYDKRGITSCLWKLLTIVSSTLIFLFLTVLPTVIQESFMEAAVSLFFNGTFVWIYWYIDFTGYRTSKIVFYLCVLLTLVLFYRVRSTRWSVRCDSCPPIDCCCISNSETNQGEAYNDETF